ncbi:DUF5819 family protein [Saccharopolyspora halophila]|uniref:DUF5819 family protein n=1 Tax=Saccharopolyspora halophila TaxID=405551 RepID=UPI0031DB3C4D
MQDLDETAPSAPRGLPRLLGAATGVAVALCLAIAVVHVLLVFLHVAPSNTISQRYRAEVDAWIYPYFEQNWRLFAPDPQSAARQISARTMHSPPGGAPQVSDWFDLTAVDTAAVQHNPFPSHTNQNMLRRAWDSYLEQHGSSDQSRSERALMMQKYLRNIAVDRIAAHRPGTFEAIQLRVITRPIARPGAADRSQPAPADTRYLPWWKVGPNGD